MRGYRGKISVRLHPVVKRGNSGIYSTVSSFDVFQSDIGIFETFISNFQQKSLLRIHPFCFLGRNPKKLRIKIKNSIQYTCFKSDTSARYSSIRILIQLSCPSRFRYFSYGALTFQQQIPIVLFSSYSTRKSECHADYSNIYITHDNV